MEAEVFPLGLEIGFPPLSGSTDADPSGHLDLPSGALRSGL